MRGPGLTFLLSQMRLHIRVGAFSAGGILLLLLSVLPPTSTLHHLLPMKIAFLIATAMSQLVFVVVVGAAVVGRTVGTVCK